MFRKPKNRNIRQRQREAITSDDESEISKPPSAPIKNDTEEDDTEPAPVISFTSKTEKSSMFSFDQDEGVDVEEFQIKKPSHKKRAEKIAKKQKELEELEKAKKLAQQRLVQDEIDIVVKNSIKITRRSDDVEPVEEDPVIIAAIEQDIEVRSRFGGFDGIPDAKAVYEAKKRREQMRRDGTKGKLNDDGDGYIALSTTKVTEKVVRSRLVREDENDMSDEDGENTQEFYSSKSLLVTEEERRRKEQEEFLRIEGESDDEELDDTAAADEEARRKAQESDEEFAEWEQHQIRKAVSTQKVKQMKHENYAVTNERPPEVIDLEGGEEDMDIEIIDEPAVMGTNIPTCSQTSLNDIIAKLRLRIEDKQSFIDAQKQELKRKEDNSVENNKLITGIEADYPVLREKYRIYQEMRLFTKDLLDCINEKFDTIVDAENKIMAMWKAKCERLMKRRRTDVQDEYQKCAALANAKPWQPTSDLMRREANNKARRSSRRVQREKAGIQGRHYEGLSSDDSEPESQKYEYQRTIAESFEAAALVFHDASEEYTDIGKIMSKFIDWIMVDQKSFDDAYIAICLPKLLSPFIRLELLDWNPLKDVSKPLHHYMWYQSLLKVGTDKLGFDLEHPTIVGLIPAVIDKLFIPRLTKIINEQWDPLSLSQSRNLSYFISYLIDETPTLTSESKSIKNMLKAIVAKFKVAIEEDTFVPLFGKDALQNSSTGCLAFLDRRFWSLIKLIRSANCFQQILSKQALHDIIIDGIINRGGVLAIQISPKNTSKIIEKCHAIIDEIPIEWLPPDDPTPYRSLITAFRLVSEASSSSNTTKIDKFIEMVESGKES